MAKQRIHRKIRRTPEEVARIKAIREKFQKEKPSFDEVLASGEYEATTQGAHLEAKILAKKLKQAREHSGMSLNDVAASTGIDASAISRLENGVYPNPTINTLNRVLSAYKKRIVFYFEDDPALTSKTVK